MKLTFLMMCAFVFSLSAGVRAQDQMVTLNVEGMPFTKVISELKRQTQLDFFYSFDEVDVKQTISLNVKNTKIDEVLQQILGGKFTWEYIDRMVIIKPAIPDEPEKKSLRVKGFVYDMQRVPMPGVTVKVAGVSLGTATNSQGWFAMDLPVTSGTLEFSFVGFKKKTVTFNTQTDTLRIVLEEDIQALDETIVVAYGETTRRKSTGSVSVVKADEMNPIFEYSLAFTGTCCRYGYHTNVRFSRGWGNSRDYSGVQLLGCRARTSIFRPLVGGRWCTDELFYLADIGDEFAF